MFLLLKYLFPMPVYAHWHNIHSGAGHQDARTTEHYLFRANRERPCVVEVNHKTGMMSPTGQSSGVKIRTASFFFCDEHQALSFDDSISKPLSGQGQSLSTM